MSATYVARGKRLIRIPGDGSTIDLGDFLLTGFVRPESLGAEAVVGEAWVEVSNAFLRGKGGFAGLVNAAGLPALLVHGVWDVVVKAVGYREDDPIFHVPDFWQLPNETWAMRKGDCEDSTFLLTSAAARVVRAFGEGRVYACVGYYIDPSTGEAYGHAFPIYSTPRVAGGEWLWLESTLDTPLPLSTWALADFSVVVPVYFFNDREAHRIDRDYRLLGLTREYVLRRKELVEEMIQYVEEGKHVRRKWMHKGRRPARPTQYVRVA